MGAVNINVLYLNVSLKPVLIQIKRKINIDENYVNIKVRVITILTSSCAVTDYMFEHSVYEITCIRIFYLVLRVKCNSTDRKYVNVRKWKHSYI